MKLKRLTFLVFLMAWILGAKAETVTIASADDWKTFAQRVNNGETSLDAVMTQDIDLQSIFH
jgi:hypothetical protein